ncbi:putative Fibroblast growth factor receptor-like protein 2 [Hypsibius exemplaris]|uniref:Fibroblast growth factor receptor-like protein 2 n=1 Tax=Hypsibius exemplaris TaxID=2072580 RepID=A0A9X6RKA2_HYPEX|nr:putative Fibroblast growth factor receptor-like protein 2 [Hypsibius exemplaris]
MIKDKMTCKDLGTVQFGIVHWVDEVDMHTLRTTIVANHWYNFRIRWTASRISLDIGGVSFRNVTNAAVIPQMGLHISVGAMARGGLGYSDSRGHVMEVTNVTLRKLLDQRVNVSNKEDGNPRNNLTSGVEIVVGQWSGAAITATGVILSVFFIASCAVLLFLKIRRRSQARSMRPWSAISTWGDVIQTMLTRAPSPEVRAEFECLLRRNPTTVEISLSALHIGSKELGRGHIGIVFKGSSLQLPDGINGTSNQLAVKAFTECSSHTFMTELNVMAAAQKHVNVIALLGVNFSFSSPLLVMEFCQYGSLLSFLQTRTHSGELHGNCVNSATLTDRNSLPTVAPHQNSVGLFSRFALQICRGMEHLVGRTIIHRDLAARNVLLTEMYVVKIADFGMASSGTTEYYDPDFSTAKRPYRWMPPEALLAGRCTEASDVWSFGVLVWELFSFGEAPFSSPELKAMSRFRVGLADWFLRGNRLATPLAAPGELRSVMSDCWNLEADSRPSFATLSSRLDEIVSSEANYLGMEDQELEQLSVVENIGLSPDETAASSCTTAL